MYSRKEHTRKVSDCDGVVHVLFVFMHVVERVFQNHIFHVLLGRNPGLLHVALLIFTHHTAHTKRRTTRYLCIHVAYPIKLTEGLAVSQVQKVSSFSVGHITTIILVENILIKTFD